MIEESKYACMIPLAKTPQSVGHMIAIDTEDDTKGNMIIGCLYGTYERRRHKGKEVVHVDETFYDRKDLNKFLHKLQTPAQRFPACVLIGFNIAYDLAYIDEEVDYESVMFSGSRFITGALKNGVEIIDIFNHGGGKSLDHWITELKLNEKNIFKTEWRKDMNIMELTKHCQNDVRAHWEMAEFFRQTYANIGVSFRLTTSSTALDLYKRRFFRGMWRRKIANFNDLEKNAYYGGRTECFKRGVERVKSYDINSAYVSAMADGLYPKPDSARRGEGLRHFKQRYKEKDTLMIVKCDVFAPKSRVMVLPYRDEESGKLLFPWGKFSGWWCSPELKEAEKYGYKILKVHEYIWYPHTDHYFRDYANYTWEQRHIASEAGDDGMKTVWKLFGNGLYGKLAQRNPVGGSFSPDVPWGEDGDRVITHVAVDGKKWYSVQSSDKVWSINSFPCISAFITCYTRLKLLEYLKRHEKDVLYCDTDSIKIPWDGKQEESSKELGEVKYEEDNSGWFCFIKPKLYGRVPRSFANLPENYDFQTPIDITHLYFNPDEDKWKIKGVGKYEYAYFDFTDMTFHTSFQKPNRFKESVRRGLTRNEWVHLEKELTLLDDKREWKYGSRDSEPRKLNECKTILTQDDNR
jgi:hypothetical protein